MVGWLLFLVGWIGRIQVFEEGLLKEMRRGCPPLSMTRCSAWCSTWGQMSLGVDEELTETLQVTIKGRDEGPKKAH